MKPVLAFSEGRVHSCQPIAKDLGGFLAKVCQEVVRSVKNCENEDKPISKTLFGNGNQLAGLLQLASNKGGMPEVTEENATNNPPKDGDDMDLEKTNKESDRDGNIDEASTGTWGGVLARSVDSQTLDISTDSLDIGGLTTAWCWLPPAQKGLDDPDTE